MTYNTKRLMAVIVWTGLLMGLGCEHTQEPGVNEALEEKIKAPEDQPAQDADATFPKPEKTKIFPDQPTQNPSATPAKPSKGPAEKGEKGATDDGETIPVPATGGTAWDVEEAAPTPDPVDPAEKACTNYDVIANILTLEKKVGTLWVQVNFMKKLKPKLYSIHGTITIDSESKNYPIGTITKVTAYAKYKSGQLYLWKPLVLTKDFLGGAVENGCSVYSSDYLPENTLAFGCYYSILENPDLGPTTELKLSFESPTSSQAIVGITSELPALQELMSCVP